jgi:hypothetical protein
MDAISDPVVRCMECHEISDAHVYKGWILVCEPCQQYLESLDD